MKIFIGTDHSGYETKKKLIAFLQAKGHDVVDCGPDSDANCDFPDYAHKVAREVAANEGSRGILLCSTGMGMSIAANRTKGVRAGLCFDTEQVKQARHHDDINVLCLGAYITAHQLIEKMTLTFLESPFEEVERRIRRMRKLDEI